MSLDNPTVGYLQLETWAGRTYQLVDIVGETPARWQIRARTRTMLAGRSRWLEVGDVAVVPRTAITFNEPPADRARR